MPKKHPSGASASYGVALALALALAVTMALKVAAAITPAGIRLNGSFHKNRN